MRRASALVAALIACSIASSASANDVVVAMRSDAPPFAEEVADGEFQGLLIEICEAAVARAGYSIAERLPIKAGDRNSAARDPEIDLICDPTTITLSRASTVDFSPIVFIANSGYLKTARPHILTEEEIAQSEECQTLRAEDADRALVGVGMVGETTANATFQLAKDRGLVGSTVEYALCRFSFESHAEGVAEVCGGFLSYYFGDLDIMLEEMGRLDECDASRADPFGAYEPYGLAIPSDKDEFRRKFVAALYELFTDGTIFQIYKSTFETDQLSDSLKMLFGFNNLPRGEAQGE